VRFNLGGIKGMDQETREMFGKVLGLLEVVKTDIEVMKTDIEVMKTDIEVMKTDIGVMKADINVLKIDTDVLKYKMNAMESRQDEIYLMLKGSEESRQRLKILEEKSLISVIERDQLKMESAKIVRALRRGAHEILNCLADEDVS